MINVKVLSSYWHAHIATLAKYVGKGWYLPDTRIKAAMTIRPIKSAWPTELLQNLEPNLHLDKTRTQY